MNIARQSGRCRVMMSFLPSAAIFCELQLVHETGYFLPQPTTLEDSWRQVTRRRKNSYFRMPYVSKNPCVKFYSTFINIGVVLTLFRGFTGKKLFASRG